MVNLISETFFHISDKIELHGRVCFEEGALCLPWSASGFTMRFVGRSVAITFLNYESNCEDYKSVAVRMEIDGVSTKATLTTGGEAVFADGLEDHEHTLRFFKISESDEPLRLNEIHITGCSPRVLPYSCTHSFKLEVVGDSITCGYGNYGVGNVFLPYEEDATKAYAWLTGEHFNAETRIISWSGKGLVKSCSGSADNRFIDFFRCRMRLEGYGKHDFTEWKPDVLVINGGTNDQNSLVVSNEEFEIGVRDFYAFARSVYPGTKIVFFVGAMGNMYDEVFKKAVADFNKSDTGVYYFTTPRIDPAKDEVGANGHPSDVGQRRIANDLIAVLEKIL